MSERTTLKQLTLFVEASLASLTVWPGSEEAQKMTVTSGQNIAALLENSTLLGLLVRTFLVSRQPFSTRCYLTWKVCTTKQGRLLFRLAPSMPRTEGTEFGLLPTPTVLNGGRSLPNGSVIRGGMSLTAYKNGKKYQVDLSQAVKRGLWATPAARDWRSGKASESTYQRNSRPLSEQVGRLENGGALNPEWVEWLMGFPTGWTDLSR